MASALDFTYRYNGPSALTADDGGKPSLFLATSSPDRTHPFFFDGRVRSPRVMGDMLIALSDIVRTHYFLPMPILLDPVLTSNESLLRVEGFSGCCGVYARADFPAEAFEGNCHGNGTTNVDFNAPMRNALMRLRDDENVQFSVGKNEVVLGKGDEKTVEKKVKLPLRWIKGFSEVQAYQPQVKFVAEVDAANALRFFRTLPKTSKPKMPSYVIISGKSLRLSQRPQRGAVKITGTHRLKAIEPLFARAKKLSIWADPENGTSAWQVCFEQGTFFMMISPEVYRGFSGEGQVLSSLAKPPSDEIIAQVRAQLKWQSEIDAQKLGNSLDLSESEVVSALSVLGSRGLAGFDVTQGSYFHRELPFDLSTVEDMQPRLKGARKLIDGGQVKIISQSEGDGPTYQVPGTGTNHRVRLSDQGDQCTCPWFSKHQGSRGPCKHILAAQLLHCGASE